jgi:hypothetical protein
MTAFGARNVSALSKSKTVIELAINYTCDKKPPWVCIAVYRL